MIPSTEKLEATEDQRDGFIAQSLTCGLVGKILYTYPDRDFLQSLADEGTFDEIPYAADQSATRAGQEHLSAWSSAVSGGMTKDAYDELQVDYCRLFIGPDKPLAIPWESVHRDITRLTFQQGTLDVRNWYARFGLQFEKVRKEPDDHIGLELAFVAALAGRAAEAIAQGNGPLFHELISAKEEFARVHLAAWGVKWAEIATEAAETDFFRGATLLAQGVITELKVELEGKPTA